MRVNDYLKIFRKLKMKVRKGKKHTIAEFWHKGHLITWTKLSHGKGELRGKLPFFIRQQLHLKNDQMIGLRDCRYYLEDYKRFLEERDLL